MNKTWIAISGLLLVIVGSLALQKYHSQSASNPPDIRVASVNADIKPANSNADIELPNVKADTGTASVNADVEVSATKISTKKPLAPYGTEGSGTFGNSEMAGTGSETAVSAPPRTEDYHVNPIDVAPGEMFPEVLAVAQRGSSEALRDLAETNRKFQTSESDKWSADMQAALRAFITAQPDASRIQWSADCRIEMCVVQFRELFGKTEPPAKSPSGIVFDSLREQPWMSQLRGSRHTALVLDGIPHVYFEFLRVH